MELFGTNQMANDSVIDILGDVPVTRSLCVHVTTETYRQLPCRQVTILQLLPVLFGAKKLLDDRAFSHLPAADAMLIGRLDERREQWMRLERLRFEFRMELATEEEWMVRDLDNFNIGSIW